MLSLPADKLSTFQEVITYFLGWKRAANGNCSTWMASLTRHAKCCMGAALSYVAFWISWTLSQVLHCIVWQPISTGIWSGGLNFLISSMVSVTFFTNAQLSLFKLMLILLIWGLFFEGDWFYLNTLVDGFLTSTLIMRKLSVLPFLLPVGVTPGATDHFCILW